MDGRYHFNQAPQIIGILHELSQLSIQETDMGLPNISPCQTGVVGQPPAAPAAQDPQGEGPRLHYYTVVTLSSPKEA